MSGILDLFKRLQKKETLLEKPKEIPDPVEESFGRVVKASGVKKEDSPVVKKESVPNELPSIGDETPNELNKVSEPESKLEPEESSNEISEPPSIEKSSESPSIENSSESKHKYRPESRKGFFADFKNFLDNKDLDEDLIRNLLDKDLLHKMKQFHVQKERGKPFFFHREDLDRSLAEKMTALKRLEEEWYLRNEDFKSSEALLIEKELDIDHKVEELKQLFLQVKHVEKLEKKADEKNYFSLPSGKHLRSLADLKQALETMDEDIFKHHVTSEKNDFAVWALHVFHDEKLAEQMSSVKTREDLISVLDNP